MKQYVVNKLLSVTASLFLSQVIWYNTSTQTKHLLKSFDLLLVKWHKRPALNLDKLFVCLFGYFKVM